MLSTADFLSPKTKSCPIIYAYSDLTVPNCLKVGYTTRTAEERIGEQYPIKRPGEKPYTIELVESALYEDGGSFTDHDVHRALEKAGFFALIDESGKKTEWFKCSCDDVRATIFSVRTQSHRKMT